MKAITNLKKTVWSLGVSVLMLSLAGCGGGESVSPEMKAFMAGFNGTYQAVEAALEKYAPGVDDQDMDIYDLKNPKVVKTELKGDLTFYTMEAKAGMTIRTYVLCWEGGKIKSIEAKGMR